MDGLGLKIWISEIVFGEDPTVKESPLRTISSGVSPGASAAQSPTLFEALIPPALVAMVATNTTPASSGEANCVKVEKTAPEIPGAAAPARTIC